MQETKIKVIDALMGKGKTSWAIQYINETNKGERIIYITPFLDEVERIKKGVTQRKMISPENKQGKWTKKQDLKQLLGSEKDIVATHALFKKVDDEIIDLIRMGNYTLILDEVMDVLEELPVTAHDYANLFEKHMTYDEKTKVCVWMDKDYTGVYEKYKRMAETGNLLNFGHKLLYWTFPVQAFQAFSSIFILTYLFDGQIQRYYYDMHRVSYTKVGIENIKGKYQLTEYKDISEQDRKHLKTLIHIHESNWNDVGKSRGKESPLSTSHLTKLKKLGDTALSKIGNTALQFYRKSTKELGVGTEAVMWTCVEEFRKHLGKEGFKRQFVPINARASNQWQDKSVCIYLANKYMRVPIKEIFDRQGIKVDQELYALSELLQWLFRSQIRKGKPVELFIPSDRMRRILQEYLGY